ncbi:MAG: D-alanyl-D-alanine carboxypeptidase family protein [Clostridia bacterium]|nr:D-alanyl-D-alanine carboxypeptidase family protein [Clostridia bacterium]MBQ5794199.1 D-alanyl-D-alanine carboxypeptidase family protein [Clostridia bacterium]
MDNQRTPRNYSTGAVKRDNRQQQQKLVVIMICIVIALLLVVFMTIIGTKIAVALLGGHQNADPSAVQYKDVTMDKSHSQYGPLALVNDTHEYKFPTEASKNLANIWDYRTAHTEDGKTPAYKTSFNTLTLDGAALTALHDMLTRFNKETGKDDVIISSAYRTYEDQIPFSVPEGKSDHHTGFGVTLKIYDGSVTSNIYDSPDYYNWFVDNAHKYGFVVRYPAEKSELTGISNYVEYFHYVGYGPATYMKENNLCLEEFVAQIKANAHNNPLQVTDANGQKWLIYYTACQGDMATVKLPTNFTYTVSGDNDGGIIVCVSLSKTAYEQQQQQEAESESAQ